MPHPTRCASLFAAAACALLAPATATARDVLSAGPIDVRGYSMTMTASDEKRHDELLFVFTRERAPERQTHVYHFQQGVSVTRDSISGSLGKYGSVKLRFRPSGVQPDVLPPGCSGTAGSVRQGSLVGRLTFRADRSYFRTVTRKKLPAAAPALWCSGPPLDPGPAAEPRLSMAAMRGGDVISLYASPTRLTVVRFDDEKRTAPATLSHMLTAHTLGLTALTEKRASVRGLEPFFSGTGSFSGEDVIPGIVSGPLRGSLTANFDSIGSVGLRGEADFRPKG